MIPFRISICLTQNLEIERAHICFSFKDQKKTYDSHPANETTVWDVRVEGATALIIDRVAATLSTLHERRAAIVPRINRSAANGRSVHQSRARNEKSGHRPADISLVNWSSTARRVPCFGSRVYPAWKRFTETKRRRHMGQQSGAKSGCVPADKPLVNRSSTGRRFP